MTTRVFRARTANLLGAVGVALFLFAGTAWVEAEPFAPNIPLGLDEEAFKVPKDNPMTTEKIELGHFLFFDKRMSKDNTISCSTCHIPALAFTDSQPVSAGIRSQQGGRSELTAN